MPRRGYNITKQNSEYVTIGRTAPGAGESFRRVLWLFLHLANHTVTRSLTMFLACWVSWGNGLAAVNRPNLLNYDDTLLLWCQPLLRLNCQRSSHTPTFINNLRKGERHSTMFVNVVSDYTPNALARIVCWQTCLQRP